VSLGSAEFRDRYGAALRSALGNAGEDSLSVAYELGRTAVRRDLSMLELAAIHNELLAAELRSSADVAAAERTMHAAGDFFLESISAYEMLQRVLRESREQARAERHHATVLRRLSSFLADASLAVDANASAQEVLQLVAEHALEVVDADACSARFEPSGGAEGPAMEAAAHSGGGPVPRTIRDERLGQLLAELHPAGKAVRMSAAELARRLPDARFAWLAAPLSALDGRPLGELQLFGFADERAFSALDEAVLEQLAQMASATFERMELYRLRHDPSDPGAGGGRRPVP
jgi:GAF domain-containing protein